LDVTAWLEALGLGQYAAAFAANDIDGDTLVSLTSDDLRELGVASIGHRKRLLSAIAGLPLADSGRRRPTASIVGGSLADAPGAGGPAPESYTPYHLAEQIRRSRASMEGERKQVTVLFADVKGSTAAIEGLDPELALKRLQPLLKAMMDAVHHYEGTVNRVQGDGIMALFGAPLALEDHAVRACCAALAMQENVAGTAGELEIRVGLHSGEVLVRSIGNDLSMDYDAIGPTVHLAARMEQLAEPGRILLTGATLSAAEGFVEAQSIGLREVKGLSRPLELFELTGLSPRETRWDARAARGLTRFVGRKAELASLERLLERATQGQGWVVAVVGEAGLGKSRLIHEFLGRPSVEGWTLHRAGAVTHGRTITYYPIYALLKSMFRLSERDSHQAAAGAVARAVEALDPNLLPILPALYSVLELPVEDPEWHQLDPPQRLRRIAEAVRALVLSQAATRPLLLLFEDLHWIDHCTRAVLDHLIDGIGAAQLFLVLTYRPDYHPANGQAANGTAGPAVDWNAKSYFSRIRLTPLGQDTADRMLVSLLGADPSLGRLKQLLFARTEGTPLFLEETVRMLAETGALEGAPGAYRLVMDVGQIEIPATVKAVLAARIDCLPVEHKNLLQIASVFRRDTPFTLLQAISSLSEADLSRRLVDLQAFELLHERRQFPEREYAFKHALTQEVAYEGILLERRIALHALLVGLLEARNPDRIDEYAERLAHHAVLGEVWDKAVHYLAKSGHKALERSDHGEATDSFEEALAALARTQAGPKRDHKEIKLRLDLVTALGPSDELGRMYDSLRAALDLANATGEPALVASVNISLANLLNIQGGFERAIESGRRALEIAAELDRPELSVGAAFVLGQAYMFHGEFRRAVDLLGRHLGSLRTHWRHRRFGTTGLSSVDCLSNLAIAHAQLGEFAEAEACGQEACRIAGELNRPFDLAIGRSELGSVHLWRGEIERAIPLLELGLAVCEEGAIQQVYPNLAAQLGHAYALVGRLDEAMVLLRRAVERATVMRLLFFETWARIYLGAALLLREEHEQALAAAEQALMHARTHKYRWQEAFALRLVGSILVETGGDADALQQAEDQLQEAMSLAQALEMRPELAHCQLALGRLQRAAGRPAEAERALDRAAELYTALGMRHWLEETRRARADSAVDAGT